MTIFLQQVFNGLTLGSVYGLVALGLTLVYGILHIPNFAHGALYMVGAFVSFYFMQDIGFNYWVAMAGAAVAVGVIAILCERLVFHPLRHAPPIHDKIAAIGILLFLEAVVHATWGSQPVRMQSPFPGVVNLGGVFMREQAIVIIIAAAVLVTALTFFLRKTMVGATIIAMAQNREGAFLVGIDANRVAMMTFAISGVLAAVAATLFAPMTLVSPVMGHVVIMKAFVIIILGGMGSIPGAIVGGMIIGMAEALGGYYVSDAYKDVIAFGLLVIILSVRPQGLFAKGAH